MVYKNGRTGKGSRHWWAVLRTLSRLNWESLMRDKAPGTKSPPNRRQVAAMLAERRVAAACRKRGLPECTTHYPTGNGQVMHCFADLDIAVVVEGQDLRAAVRLANSLACDGWFTLIVSRQQWADGTALDLVARVV
jgi:hypothetical protein